MSDEFCGYRAIKVSLHRLLCEIVESCCIQILRLMMNTPQTWDGFPTIRFATWFSYWIWHFLGSMLKCSCWALKLLELLGLLARGETGELQKKTNLFIEKQTLWVTEPLTWKAQQCSTCGSYLCTMNLHETRWNLRYPWYADFMYLSYQFISLYQHNPSSARYPRDCDG